jgi:hypothetical protein
LLPSCFLQWCVALHFCWLLSTRPCACHITKGAHDSASQIPHLPQQTFFLYVSDSPFWGQNRLFKGDFPVNKFIYPPKPGK